MKLRTVYICNNCEYQSFKWLGQCPECEEWNSLIEDVINVGKKDELIIPEAKAHQTIKIDDQSLSNKRLETNISELDNVLGGGLVEGSLTLLGGQPGIGKSTLTLQICQKLSENNKQILYISGEESVSQIAMRAKRLQAKAENLNLVNANQLEAILATIKKLKPDLAIIDSIQVINSEVNPGMAGSISQIRYCTEAFMSLAKSENITILLIGHVTKDGNLAGPKVLEHLVDTVLHLEGDRYHEMRILRSFKNRFGSTSELGLFEMRESGLEEVSNPSAKLLQDRQQNAIGSCLSLTIEGSRPFIIEVQALTSLTAFGYPKRTASGFDVNRLNLLIAVLQKHAGINLANQDIYINIVGGFKVKDPAVDLAVCLAIISSFKKQPLDSKIVAMGEIGLCGEIRKPSQMGKREKEIEKLELTQVKDSKVISELIKELF